jgi:hypothetical protein
MKTHLTGDEDIILDKVFEILDKYITKDSTEKITREIEAFKRVWKLKAEVKKTNEA